jgi:protein-tyrosine phosphatase
LAIAPRPRGGDWLADDIHALSSEGVEVLISTLTAGERTELGLVDEERLARDQGLDFVWFPIEDRSVPASVPATAELVERVRSDLTQGKAVAIHCRSGIGRSSLLSAAVLAASGIDVSGAFKQIERARGLAVPDTTEQRAWVERFARDVFGRPQRAAS